MNHGADETLHEAEQALAARSLHDARRLFDEAEALGANSDRCGAGRWMAHMLKGDYAAAWKESDAIQARHPDDPERLWRGEDIAGKRVMLRCLHGYGDAVQFLRFAPNLRARAAWLIVEVAPSLVELASRMAGVDEVITWGEHAPAVPPAWDVQIEINELMYMLRIAQDDVRRDDPYLTLPKELLLRHAPRPRNERNLRVGLVWTAGAWNPERSIPFQALQPIFEAPGCEFWNLQGGPARDDWGALRGLAFHDADDCADSIAGLAALIAQLDLVVACDTLAVHLAGAQGAPCWALLQHAADWRWMHGRDDTPWYRSVRLRRRVADDTWDSFARRLAEELAPLAEQVRASREDQPL